MLDVKYIRGLTVTKSVFTGTKEIEGRPVRQFDVQTQPMRLEDVLAYKEYEKEVVFVTSDGKKYTLPLILSGKEVKNAVS